MNVTYSPFQANKVHHLIMSRGESYRVIRKKKNEFGEAEEALEDDFELYIKAILHKGNPSRDRTGDGTVTKFSQQEQLLCCYTDAKLIHIGDIVQNLSSGVSWEVENVDNIQEGDFAIDLSLRRIINGVNI